MLLLLALAFADPGLIPVPVPAPPAPAPSRWTVERETSLMDDSRAVYAGLYADAHLQQANGGRRRPLLVVACQEGVLMVALDNGGVTEGPTLRWRVDQEPALVLTAESRAEGTALLLPEREARAREIGRAARIAYEVTLFGMEPQAVAFSPQPGGAEVVAEVLAACGRAP